ncbi:MASE1 domain-containing protein [Xanthomonas campestris pv. phormiicola]|nr:MASE1 domain-containing protein [Xanthomonas campestris pv. phormiicola]UYC17401.1 MASE1 domain-containing protein [Xanthomonas campestris pv. phormiicola]
MADSLKTIVQGTLLAIGYCLAFQAAWHCSFDQWYLPAGLRLAVLLFAPYRLLPYFLLGDAAALLMLRVPAITSMGVNPTWAYCSSWILMPAISAVPLAIRARLRDLQKREAVLVPMLLLAAVWGALCSVGINIMLDGPKSTMSWEKLARFIVGDYLGMMMVILPTLLWLRRNDDEVPGRILPHVGWAVATIATVSGLVVFVPDDTIRLVLMALMIAPAIMLTRLHGWRGATLGVVLANVAIALSLPRTGVLGTYDEAGFLVQVLLAIAATGLFVLGSRISSAVDETRAKIRGQEQAVRSARQSYLWSERCLRDRVVQYVDVQVQVNKLRRDIETYLKSRGQHDAAMQMVRTGFIQAQLLNDYVTALYPLQIETHGLFHVLRSSSFANVCNTEIEARVLRGQPRDLSIGLQLAAYRGVLQVIEQLPRSDRHVIKARVWKAGGAQGIAVSVRVDGRRVIGVRQTELDGDGEMVSRFQAYGGTYKRRHRLAISFLVSEAKGTRSVFRYDDPGTAVGSFL